jgi:tetratricopeptide (TPR) repeat protein
VKKQERRPFLTTIIEAMKEQVIAGGKGNAIHDCWYSRGFAHFTQHPGSQRFVFVPNFLGNALFTMRRRVQLILIPAMAVLAGVFAAPPVSAAPTAPSSLPPVSGAASYAAGANSVKAHELVGAAINMTDSERAVKLLWQATELDPTLDEPYMYLALYYDSRSQFDKVVEVYQKLLKYQPREATAYINIGEAYMSFSPPKVDSALPYYLKALQLEPENSFAALRIGEVYAQKGDPYRGQALRYLNLARSDRSKNPTTAAEADKVIHQMGAS